MRREQAEIKVTNNKDLSMTWGLYCCLVPQCEALRTCCFAFPITTKWYFDQDVKVVPGPTFTKRTCNRCCSLQKRGNVVATSWLALHWNCGFRMSNTWKSPDINMYMDLNLATFQYSEELNVIIFAWTGLDWNWWFSFELLRNVRLSFGTADYCNFRFSFRTAG